MWLVLPWVYIKNAGVGIGGKAHQVAGSTGCRQCNGKKKKEICDWTMINCASAEMSVVQVAG